MKGRNLSEEDFLELLRLRNFCISSGILKLIVDNLFPNSKNNIFREYNENHMWFFRILIIFKIF